MAKFSRKEAWADEAVLCERGLRAEGKPGGGGRGCQEPQKLKTAQPPHALPLPDCSGGRALEQKLGYPKTAAPCWTVNWIFSFLTLCQDPSQNGVPPQWQGENACRAHPPAKLGGPGSERGQGDPPPRPTLTAKHTSSPQLPALPSTAGLEERPQLDRSEPPALGSDSYFRHCTMALGPGGDRHAMGPGQMAAGEEERGAGAAEVILLRPRPPRMVNWGQLRWLPAKRGTLTWRGHA